MKNVVIGALTQVPYEHGELCLNCGKQDIGPFAEWAKCLRVDFDDMLFEDCTCEFHGKKIGGKHAKVKIDPKQAAFLAATAEQAAQDEERAPIGETLWQLLRRKRKETNRDMVQRIDQLAAAMSPPMSRQVSGETSATRAQQDLMGNELLSKLVRLLPRDAD